MKIKKNEILLTGAAGSVGSILEKHFSKKNLNPILVDKKKIKKKNYFQSNITKKKQINNLIEKIFKEFPNIKVLINCTGYIHNEISYNFIKNTVHSEKNLNKVLNENFIIPYLLSVIFAKQLVSNRKSGLIINFSSVNSKGVMGQSVYSASKKALEVCTKVWSQEFKGTNIRFACISPGYMNLVSTYKNTSKNQIKKIIEKNPMQRMGEEEELFSAINFIISNDYFNGKTLNLDGGL